MPLPRSEPKPSRSFSFDAIGTKWEIEIYASLAGGVLAEVQQAVGARIEVFDRHYSRFRNDSLISQMAQKSGDYVLPDDAQLLFDLYHELYDMTDGAMTPLIGQTLVDAGYDANYSLKPGELKTPPAWDDVLVYNFPSLQLKKPALLDLGAAGKGYLVDIIGNLLAARGINNFCIDAGGDMLHQTPGDEILKIGLEDPDNPKQVIGVADIHDQSICGSSGNRRAWGAYNHIIDPHLLRSLEHIRALWVVADSALLADALATALFFTSATTLYKRYTFEYALLRSNAQLEYSANFPGKFFSE
jgi:thiamine biosynthesis lipoprotein